MRNKKISVTICDEVYKILQKQANEQEVPLSIIAREILHKNFGVSKKEIWNKERKEKLQELYGTMDRTKLCKKLKITTTEFRRLTKELNLGFQKDFDERVTQKQVCEILGIDHYKIKIFRNNGLPAKEFRFGSEQSQRYNVMIRMDELIEWLEKHQDMFEANKIEHMALGSEPEWLRKKRRAEYNKASSD